MQINGFSSAAILGAYRTGAKAANAAKKTSQTHGMSFDLMVRNEQPNKAEQTDKTAAAAPLTPEEEMAAFKQEIYDELAEINGMGSFKVLSNSVHITEDGFKRMKEDPEYRKEIMDWLRADARASHGLPHSTHSTTTITGAGATTRVVSDDLYRKDPSTKTMFDQKAKDSFFHSSRSDRADRANADRKAAQRKRDQDYVIRERQQRELMQKMMLDKSMAQKAQRQELIQGAIDQKYLNAGMMGMPPSKSWNI